MKLTSGTVVKVDAAGKSVWDIFDDIMEYTAELELKEEMAEMDKN